VDVHGIGLPFRIKDLALNTTKHELVHYLLLWKRKDKRTLQYGLNLVMH